MIINKCEHDTVDPISGMFVCSYSLSPKFAMLKTGYCVNRFKGCKFWNSHNPLSVLNMETMDFEPIPLMRNITS